MKILLIFLLGVIMLFSAKAQNIENLVFRLEGTDIIINYDLIGKSEESYYITVFSSHNNFSEPITFVSGDVGNNVIPGTGKIVIWDAKKELGEFKGNLQIKVKARFVPLVEFENVSNASKYMRGKSHEIKWISNTNQDNLRLELYLGNELLNHLGQVSNSGAWNWTIPKNQNPGKGFRFKASGLNRSAYSAEFRISRKIPLLIKIIPIVGGIGGLIAILSSGGGSGEPQKVLIELPLLPD